MTGGAWQVLTAIGSEWENVWTEDDKPQTFSSRQDAEQALSEHVEAINEAVRAGHLADSGPETFAIENTESGALFFYETNTNQRSDP